MFPALYLQLADRIYITGSAGRDSSVNLLSTSGQSGGFLLQKKDRFAICLSFKSFSFFRIRDVADAYVSVAGFSFGLCTDVMPFVQNLVDDFSFIIRHRIQLSVNV